MAMNKMQTETVFQECISLHGVGAVAEVLETSPEHVTACVEGREKPFVSELERFSDLLELGTNMPPLTGQDLKAVADIGRIVKNLRMMRKLVEKGE